MCLPNPIADRARPEVISHFCPIILWERLCQYPMNQAAGKDTKEEPSE
jgi:hypothetical protein